MLHLVKTLCLRVILVLNIHSGNSIGKDKLKNPQQSTIQEIVQNERALYEQEMRITNKHF